MQTPIEPIWAKSPEKGGGREVTLREHTQHVLDAFEGLKGKVDPAKLEDLIRVAILCHDFGKVLPAFQTRTLKHEAYRPFGIEPNPPHSLVSALWINQEKLRQIVAERLAVGADSAEAESYARFVLSAVAYHHWREDFNEMIRYGDTPLGRLCEKWTSNGERASLERNLLNELSSLDPAVKELLSFNREMAEGICNGAPFSRYVIPPYQLYWLPARIPVEDEKMRDWILIAGFLMRSDHFASFLEKDKRDPKTPIELSPPDNSSIEERITQDLRKPKGEIWQIDIAAKHTGQNTILVAPTGFGKTEFAFLWSAGQKFFYTLPLRSAVNQVFGRTQRALQNDDKDERVGLLHSDADVYLSGDGAETEAMPVYDFSRQLSYPAIVSTGDQFFPYALRPPTYEKIFATFSYSRLVIDEVQAYDPRAAAIVVKFIEDVVRMGKKGEGKFLLMTATLPEFVLSAVNESLKRIGHQPVEPISLYEEYSQLKELCKHELQFKVVRNEPSDGRPKFELRESELNEILDQAKSGKRVLVILNTVKQAQDVYRRLREIAKGGLEKRMWLLHSRFTQKDRADLELMLCGDKKRIKRKEPGEFENPKPDNEKVSKILVATQVIEASSDIDADVLFTELAPMDSLVQRMGRVLRRVRLDSPKTDPAKVFVWIFSHGWESGNGRVYEKELLYKTMKLITDPAKHDTLINDLRSLGGGVNWSEIQVETPSQEQAEHGKKTKRGGREKKTKKGQAISAEDLKIVLEPGKVHLLSEYRKYDLVKAAYASLSPEGTYLSKFNQTIEMLNAGYRSDRKEEAQLIFREIRSIDVVPSGKKGEFLSAISIFLREFAGKKHQYTHFKREVLSKFVISMPFRWGKLEDLSSERLEFWFEERHAERDDLRRLKSWCRDIYAADAVYDELGCVISKERTDDDRFIGW